VSLRSFLTSTPPLPHVPLARLPRSLAYSLPPSVRPSQQRGGSTAPWPPSPTASTPSDSTRLGPATRHLSRPQWRPRHLSRPLWPPRHMSRPHSPPRLSCFGPYGAVAPFASGFDPLGLHQVRPSPRRPLNSRSHAQTGPAFSPTRALARHYQRPQRPYRCRRRRATGLPRAPLLLFPGLLLLLHSPPPLRTSPRVNIVTFSLVTWSDTRHAAAPMTTRMLNFPSEVGTRECGCAAVSRERRTPRDSLTIVFAATRSLSALTPGGGPWQRPRPSGGDAMARRESDRPSPERPFASLAIAVTKTRNELASRCALCPKPPCVPPQCNLVEYTDAVCSSEAATGTKLARSAATPVTIFRLVTRSECNPFPHHIFF